MQALKRQQKTVQAVKRRQKLEEQQEAEKNSGRTASPVFAETSSQREQPNMWIAASDSAVATTSPYETKSAPVSPTRSLSPSFSFRKQIPAAARRKPKKKSRKKVDKYVAMKAKYYKPKSKKKELWEQNISELLGVSLVLAGTAHMCVCANP